MAELFAGRSPRGTGGQANVPEKGCRREDIAVARGMPENKVNAWRQESHGGSSEGNGAIAQGPRAAAQDQPWATSRDVTRALASPERMTPTLTRGGAWILAS